MRDFEKWFKTFQLAINGYDYFVDYKKVYKNIDEDIKDKLNMLNALIGSNNIEKEFDKIITKYPSTLSCIPLILAVREKELYCKDKKKVILYDFSIEEISEEDKEKYKYFLRKTGIFDLLQNHDIKNLYDYCLGVEVGLDSNGRKNRGGKQMEKLVETFIKKAGVEYYTQMRSSKIEKDWGVKLSSLSVNKKDKKKKADKKWDFVVKISGKVYLIETNFYKSQGSKLNEVARSYKMIAEEVKQCKDVEFIWITDGSAGWSKSKNNLQETFQDMKHLYNIADLENGILKTIFKI